MSQKRCVSRSECRILSADGRLSDLVQLTMQRPLIAHGSSDAESCDGLATEGSAYTPPWSCMCLTKLGGGG